MNVAQILLAMIVAIIISPLNIFYKTSRQWFLWTMVCDVSVSILGGGEIDHVVFRCE